MGERENITAIEVTPESPALAQGEEKVMMEKEKRARERDICEATCQMGHARSVLWPCDVFSVLTIRRKNTLKRYKIKINCFNNC